MKVYQALAEAFVGEGTRHVFSLMGDGNMLWQAALGALGEVAIYDVRHEGAGVAMADGYFRATGQVGVCAVTSGPGLTQTATAMMAARRHGSAIVVFAGDTPAAGKRMGGLQDIDQQRFAEASGAYFVPVRSPATVHEDVQRAFYVARVENRPVVLNAPMDIQAQTMASCGPYIPSTHLIVTAGTLVPPAHEVEAAMELLVAAQRPIVLAGRGAAGAVGQVNELADRLDAFIATTVRAKGWFDDNPGALDIAGGFSSAVAEDLFAQADLVVAVGAALGEHTTAANTLFPRARTIRIDKRPVLDPPHQDPADCYLHGDAAATLDTLLDTMKGRVRGSGFRQNGYESKGSGTIARQALQSELADHKMSVEPGTVDPRHLMLELDRLLPPECVIVLGAGHFWSFPARFLSGGKSRRFYFSYDFGSISHGLPVAIGVSIALSCPVALVEGDASLIMNIQELDTVSRHGVPLLIVAMNDGALGAEYHKLRAQGLDTAGSVVATPPLAEVARAFGLAGETVDNVAALARYVSPKQPWNKPILLDAHVSRAVPSRLYMKKYAAPVH